MGRNDRRFGHSQEPGGNDVVDTYLSTLKARYWRAFLWRAFHQAPARIISHLRHFLWPFLTASLPTVSLGAQTIALTRSPRRHTLSGASTVRRPLASGSQLNLVSDRYRAESHVHTLRSAPARDR